MGHDPSRFATRRARSARFFVKRRRPVYKFAMAFPRPLRTDDRAPVATPSASVLPIGAATQTAQRIVERVATVIRGKDATVRAATTALIAGGHLLIEDVPGVGKTTLALAVARAIGCTFRRIQFTSDLLPTDVVGVSVLDPHTREFEFKPGPVFSHVVLADEINRAAPRTQSALLEAMGEGRVSVDNHTHDLPRPFWVVATQNPVEHHGTYPLPESQMDRFLMRLSVGYPPSEAERELVLSGGMTSAAAQLTPAVRTEDVVAAQASVSRVATDGALVDYVMEIVDATRRSEMLALGASPRGAIALLQAARAHALTCGRTYCVPDDVVAVAVPVLAHRIVPAATHAQGGRERVAASAVIEMLLSRIAVPR
jgi:MoxR-like ATPase